jgi:hypothetical protein
MDTDAEAGVGFPMSLFQTLFCSPQVLWRSTEPTNAAKEGLIKPLKG